MCTLWSKNLVILGVLASFIHPWFIIIAIYPFVARLITHLTGRNWWPATTSCAVSVSERPRKGNS
ncbi:MAG: hypothetical protein C7B44_06835 [Sulfobacillus thermosulfidooxidans]|uniref:Uncharacterized protein n=1 Tax=Sulfobacillus thermotolerans TaxID=338644 RepID=A0ABM6RQS2_9FIRM|nr:hypothetical protein [Sulfobacillus sp. hq2]AUW93617.1 hypothetical protein BXT84_06390 [Sulfobacillus thermotolerans]MCY0907044.1 hypothetical protein [Sulfobacillus thermotolerans]POB10861.1 hypothetical protein CO251_08620 [Sulfobacillus sp. hq2]PSR36844.1 MAG: hypothetical protein C7B44_06835 [Sulfobacillus thermosulfidooxidans]